MKMVPERLGRHDDERLYQPRSHSRGIRDLYPISQQTEKPLTVLVDRALQESV